MPGGDVLEATPTSATVRPFGKKGQSRQEQSKRYCISQVKITFQPVLSQALPRGTMFACTGMPAQLGTGNNKKYVAVSI